MSTIFYERVLFYVIVACRRKLVRRIKHPTLSKPFMQSLDAIGQTVTFADPPIGQEQPNPSVHSDERKHDVKFLEFLLAAQTIVGSQIAQKAPLLCELARAVQKDENHPFQLYTRETCQEYHNVLMEALHQFETYLVKLLALEKGQSSALQECLYAILTYGNLLMKISLGSAVAQHLKTIEAVLRIHHRAHSEGADDDSEHDGDQLEEPDDDLIAVQTYVVDENGVPRPLWKSYMDWFRLILSLFESVEIICAYITLKPDLPIVFRLVVPPEDPALDRQMLPWKELLSDPDLFPTSASDSDEPTSETTNAEIIEFITNSINSLPDPVRKVQDRITATMPVPKLRIICRRLATNILAVTPKLPTDSPVYPFKEASMAILAKILPNLALLNPAVVKKVTDHRPYLYDCSLAPKAIAGLDEINKLLRNLDDATRFFHYLKTMDNNFTGTLHCEACLASLAASSVQHGARPILKDLAVRPFSPAQLIEHCTYIWYRNASA